MENNKTKKEYKIKTIADIIALVTEENSARFLTDFAKWLAFMVAMKESVSMVAAIQGVPIEEILKEFERDEMVWFDDGKESMEIIIKTE